MTEVKARPARLTQRQSSSGRSIATRRIPIPTQPLAFPGKISSADTAAAPMDLVQQMLRYQRDLLERSILFWDTF